MKAVYYIRIPNIPPNEGSHPANSRFFVLLYSQIELFAQTKNSAPSRTVNKSKHLYATRVFES